MTDTLTKLTSAVLDVERGALAGQPVTPHWHSQLAERVEAFASAHPELDPDTRTRLLTRLARTIDPGCPADSVQALAVIELAVAGHDWQEARDEERQAADRARGLIATAHRYGVTEERAARAAGVTRTTVRRALGKQ